MTRQEFIVTLREGLRKLPPEEIVAATEFYEEYFDEVLESGEKTEEEILDELGSPKRIAAQIRADLSPAASRSAAEASVCARAAPSCSRAEISPATDPTTAAVSITTALL